MPSITTVGRVGIVWLPSLLLTFIFLMAGLPKLAGAEGHIRHFVTWGYPDWFRLVVGAIEVTSAVLLLVPRLAFFGALGIAVIMSGATYTPPDPRSGRGEPGSVHADAVGSRPARGIFQAPASIARSALIAPRRPRRWFDARW